MTESFIQVIRSAINSTLFYHTIDKFRKLGYFGLFKNKRTMLKRKITVDGRVYFVNHDLRISTWEDPCKTSQQQILSLISLPYGWETRLDSKSGRQYFFNRISKATTWDAPQSANDLRAIGLIDENWKYKEFSDRDSDKLKNGLFVALKRLNYSSKINDQFLYELKFHLNAFKMTKFLFPLLGITQDPETSEYIIVMNYAHGGSLRNIEDIKDDIIKQAIVQFRNSDKKLQEISIQPTVQNAGAYFTSRTINLSEINRIITGFKENEESDYKLFSETQIEQ
ncbi:24075_t:CDS:2, partial [Dentiscutata erythropus]